MTMNFVYKGKVLYSIPLADATTENVLWHMDMLAETYDVPACSIHTRVSKEQIKA